METELFDEPIPSAIYQPLANRVRPKNLSQFVGQAHIIGNNKTLSQSIKSQVLHSMVFWGPPGTGKTTLAKIIANTVEAHFISISAVLSGVKEIRKAIAQAQHWKKQAEKTILFVDEVHRFNKSQQDAFLPHIEDGTIYFIGASTENPSFELNNALLSRVKVYTLKPLTQHDLVTVLQQALAQDVQLQKKQIKIDDNALVALAKVSDGDARRALNFLEIACDLAEKKSKNSTAYLIDLETIEQVSTTSLRRFDKGGDVFYEQISALHKSVRGSSPDAALYWFARMIDGGCDPHYIARRVVRMASEDIGNADPRGLQLALTAWKTYQQLGSPEGELAIAQAVVYLAATAKSNAVYTAYHLALSDAKKSASYDVPQQLKNAPTALMKDLGYGKNYRYTHNETDAFAAGEHYFPVELGEREYYFPVERGLELKIKEKLEKLKSQNEESRKKN